MNAKFKFGEVEVEIAPLPISKLKKLRVDMEKAKKFGPFAEDDVQDAVVAVVQSAIVSVSPAGEVTAEQVADHVNLGNFGEIWGALLGVPVERVKPGEAHAGQGAA